MNANDKTSLSQTLALGMFVEVFNFPRQKNWLIWKISLFNRTACNPHKSLWNWNYKYKASKSWSTQWDWPLILWYFCQLWIQSKNIQFRKKSLGEMLLRTSLIRSVQLFIPPTMPDVIQVFIHFLLPSWIFLLPTFMGSWTTAHNNMLLA